MNLSNYATNRSSSTPKPVEDTNLCREIREIAQKAWNTTNDKIIRLQGVADMTGRARSTLWKDIKTGVFPRPVEIGARARGWRASEVSAWMEARTFATRSSRSIDMKAFVQFLTSKQEP